MLSGRRGDKKERWEENTMDARDFEPTGTLGRREDAVSRRGVFAGAGAALAAAGVAVSGLPGAGLAAPRRGWIDVHHHFDPNLVIPGSLPPGPRMPGGWTLARDLADMDRGGVQTALLSWFAAFAGAPEGRVRDSRAINEAGARLVADHPRRYALLATLPVPDVDASLAELAHGLGALNAVGVCLPTNDGTRWLGDARYDPLFAELNRRKAAVFVHPVAAPCCRNLVPGVPDTVIEFEAETTRCIASLIFGGMTTRFPEVRFVFSHGGGATMAVIERFLGGTHGQIAPGIDTQGVAFFPATQPPGGALAELRRMYFDIAQASNPVMLRVLKTVLPPTGILYGTDFPFQTAEVTTRQLEAAGVFGPAELEAVGRGNALRLFPRLAT
jgi:predicted TIM-barrel fold metal-dependent hydrolase